MRLHVTLYGTLRSDGERAGGDAGFWIELPDGACARDLLERLRSPAAGKGVVIHEGRILGPDAALRDGAFVGVFQPMAGG